MSLPILELAAEALPHIPLDHGVQYATTGRIVQDILPLLTMACMAPTLLHFYRKRRFGDIATFGLGFLLAIIYHIAHLEGLEESSVFGVPGSLWRSLDILVAQSLLGRTVGHAIGARSLPVRLLSNVAFPLLLISWSIASKRAGDIVPVLTLGRASRSLLAIIIATLVTKLAVEGRSTFPRYSKQRGRRAIACFVFGFGVFPLPEILPEAYWLCHSLWHVFMALGYWELYQELLRHEAADKKAQQHKQQKCAIGTDTLTSSSSSSSSSSPQKGHNGSPNKRAPLVVSVTAVAETLRQRRQ